MTACGSGNMMKVPWLKFFIAVQAVLILSPWTSSLTIPQGASDTFPVSPEVAVATYSRGKRRKRRRRHEGHCSHLRTMGDGQQPLARSARGVRRGRRSSRPRRSRLRASVWDRKRRLPVADKLDLATSVRFMLMQQFSKDGFQMNAAATGIFCQPQRSMEATRTVRSGTATQLTATVGSLGLTGGTPVGDTLCKTHSSTVVASTHEVKRSEENETPDAPDGAANPHAGGEPLSVEESLKNQTLNHNFSAHKTPLKKIDLQKQGKGVYQFVGRFILDVEHFTLTTNYSDGILVKLSHLSTNRFREVLKPSMEPEEIIHGNLYVQEATNCMNTGLCMEEFRKSYSWMIQGRRSRIVTRKGIHILEPCLLVLSSLVDAEGGLVEFWWPVTPEDSPAPKSGSSIGATCLICLLNETATCEHVLKINETATCEHVLKDDRLEAGCSKG